MQKNKEDMNCVESQKNAKIVCEICGSPHNNLDFKGKKVCEDCVDYVKSHLPTDHEVNDASEDPLT